MNNVTKNPYRVDQMVALELAAYIEDNKTDGEELNSFLFTTDEDGNIKLEAGVGDIVKKSENFDVERNWQGGATFVVKLGKGTTSTIEEAYKYLRDHRVDFILHNALVRSTIKDLSEAGYGLNNSFGYFSISGSSSTMFVELLRIFGNAEYKPIHLQEAVGYYHVVYGEYKTRMRQRGSMETQQKTIRGISALVLNKAQDPVDVEVIEEQIQQAQTKLSDSLVGRTWGWEVEAPNPGDFTSIPGVEAGSDGSVESFEASDEDCSCDCRDCTYHSCDCDNCDQYNEDVEHCRDSDCYQCRSYEFRTVGGVTRALHPGLKNLLGQISDTEKNETAGTHIHVYARDLSAFQIGVALGGYALTQKVWDVLAGRNAEDDQRCRTYANVLPAEDIAETLRTKKLRSVGKFTAVNTLHVTSDRGTLEFRQMDCNFDFNRISLMAFMVRGLVEVAKRGATIAEFIHITDLNGLIKLYNQYGYTFGKESETIDNPHGSRYNQSRTAPQLV